MITRFFIAISFVLIFSCQNTSADHSKKYQNSRKIQTPKPIKLEKNKAKKEDSKVYNRKGFEIVSRLDSGNKR